MRRSINCRRTPNLCACTNTHRSRQPHQNAPWVAAKPQLKAVSSCITLCYDIDISSGVWIIEFHCRLTNVDQIDLIETIPIGSMQPACHCGVHNFEINRGNAHTLHIMQMFANALTRINNSVTTVAPNTRTHAQEASAIGRVLVVCDTLAACPVNTMCLCHP